MGEEILIDEEELEKLDKKLSKKTRSIKVKKLSSKIRCKVYLKMMNLNINNIRNNQREDIMDYFGLTYKELNDLL